MRRAVVICLAALIAAPAGAAEDLFVGVFESETRENFGSDTPGEYRIEVTAVAEGKYAATLYKRGNIIGTKNELVRCPVESEGYLRNRSPGRAEVLCSKSGGSLSSFLSYSENGIHVPAVKKKYAANPELVKQEGLQPGDPSLFESRHHRATYYAHVPWLFYGFRKIKP